LQQGVILLPLTEDNQVRLQQLRNEVLEFEGTASLGQSTFLNQEDENSILNEFERLRNEEYEELAENCERLMYGLDRVTEKGKISFTELEENEIEFLKLKHRFEKITTRDFFQAKGKIKAQAILDKAQERLNGYGIEVYKKEKNNM